MEEKNISVFQNWIFVQQCVINHTRLTIRLHPLISAHGKRLKLELDLAVPEPQPSCYRARRLSSTSPICVWSAALSPKSIALGEKVEL